MRVELVEGEFITPWPVFAARTVNCPYKFSGNKPRADVAAPFRVRNHAWVQAGDFSAGLSKWKIGDNRQSIGLTPRNTSQDPGSTSLCSKGSA
jgi:hypothetical protein